MARRWTRGNRSNIKLMEAWETSHSVCKPNQKKGSIVEMETALSFVCCLFFFPWSNHWRHSVCRRRKKKKNFRDIKKNYRDDDDDDDDDNDCFLFFTILKYGALWSMSPGYRQTGQRGEEARRFLSPSPLPPIFPFVLFFIAVISIHD